MLWPILLCMKYPEEIKTPGVALFLMFLVLIKSVKKIRLLGDSDSNPSLFYCHSLKTETFFNLTLCNILLSAASPLFSNYKCENYCMWQPTRISKELSDLLSLATKLD